MAYIMRGFLSRCKPHPTMGLAVVGMCVLQGVQFHTLNQCLAGNVVGYSDVTSSKSFKITKA